MCPLDSEVTRESPLQFANEKPSRLTLKPVSTTTVSSCRGIADTGATNDETRIAGAATNMVNRPANRTTSR